jgi:transposase InsO family protein
MVQRLYIKKGGRPLEYEVCTGNRLAIQCNTYCESNGQKWHPLGSGQKYGIQLSMGSVGDCFDNALCKSFFATLECELLVQHIFTPPKATENAVFAFIEG